MEDLPPTTELTERQQINQLKRQRDIAADYKHLHGEVENLNFMRILESPMLLYGPTMLMGGRSNLVRMTDAMIDIYLGTFREKVPTLDLWIENGLLVHVFCLLPMFVVMRKYFEPISSQSCICSSNTPNAHVHYIGRITKPELLYSMDRTTGLPKRRKNGENLKGASRFVKTNNMSRYIKAFHPEVTGILNKLDRVKMIESRVITNPAHFLGTMFYIQRTTCQSSKLHDDENGDKYHAFHEYHTWLPTYNKNVPIVDKIAAVKGLPQHWLESVQEQHEKYKRESKFTNKD